MGALLAALVLIGGVSWISQNLIILQDCKKSDAIAIDATTLQIFDAYQCKHGLQLAVPTSRVWRLREDVPL